MFKNKKKFTTKKDDAGTTNGVRSNSNNTMSWARGNTSKHSGKSEVQDSSLTKGSLTAENMYLAVILPRRPDYYVEDYNKEREAVHEWWAENLVDFYNEICVMFGVLTNGNKAWGDVCDHPDKYENGGFPKGVKYMWKASKDAPPKELPVDMYIDHIIIWIEGTIQNEEVFPTDEDVPFPADFKVYAKKIFKRLFRVLAIFYSNECLYKTEVAEKQLSLCFRHFLYFMWKWDLVEAHETKCIDKFVAPIRQKFDRDQKLFKEKKLPILNLTASNKSMQKE